MTDRVKGFLVILDKDMREDDAEAVLTALRMTKHVLSVKEVKSEHYDDMVAEERIRRDLTNKLWAVLHPETK